MRRGPPRVVVLTNIVAPYRIPTLRELALRTDLTVLFSAEVERDRHWSVERQLPFPYEIVAGPAVRAHGRAFYMSPGIIARLRARAPSVVIVGGFSFPTLYALGYCMATDASLILMSEGTKRTERHLGVPRLLLRRLLIRRARGFVGVSTAAVEWFEELGAPPERCVVAPYALDVGQRPTRGLAADDDAPARLLFVGQLIPRKGIRQLLLAFAALSRSHNVRLTILGTGTLEADLIATVRALGLDGLVDFGGFVDQPHLPEVYARHDLFVFPTLEDTFGVVLLEAMSAGIPVVASQLAGATRDFVADGRNGWVLDAPSVEGIHRALVRALDRRPDWPLLGLEARRTMKATTPTNVANELMRVISLASR